MFLLNYKFYILEIVSQYIQIFISQIPFPLSFDYFKGFVNLQLNIKSTLKISLSSLFF